MPVVVVYPDACPSSCSAHGTCVSDSGAFCACDFGYTGASCDVPAPSVTAASVETSALGFCDVLPWLLFGLLLVWLVVSHARRWYARRRRRSVAIQANLLSSPPVDPSAPFSE